jgi:hypothetical protein
LGKDDLTFLLDNGEHEHSLTVVYVGANIVEAWFDSTWYGPNNPRFYEIARIVGVWKTNPEPEPKPQD